MSETSGSAHGPGGDTVAGAVAVRIARAADGPRVLQLLQRVFGERPRLLGSVGAASSTAGSTSSVRSGARCASSPRQTASWGRAAKADVVACTFPSRAEALRCGFSRSPQAAMITAYPRRAGTVLDPALPASWSLSLGDLELL